jgi:thiamine-monophosphate kinase
MRRLSEFQIIDLISRTVGIDRKRIVQNDDVSTIQFHGKMVAVKCDMLVQSTDVPKQMELWQVSRKSIVSCLSDLACKGVRPLATLISLAIPRDFAAKDIAELARGFRGAEREFNVNIIGGDTNEGKELVIDCCMVGAADRIVKRSGARNGDLIITSGPFGYSASGLRILTKYAKSEGNFRKTAVKAVLMPEPCLKFGLALARYATSSMDSSDGLAFTLHELCRMSKKKFLIDELPTTDEVREFAKLNRYDLNELVLYGGEEYEIVATIPQEHLARVKSLARNLGCKLFVIGTVAKGRGVAGEFKSRIERRGWEHLA